MKNVLSIALSIGIVLSSIALISFLMVPVDIHASATCTTEILVNISEVAQIDVTPDQIAWLQIAPGANGTVRNITVKNIGSNSFSNGIYVSVDSFGNATNNPTVGDDSTKYMAGSFLVAGNSTDLGNDEWWFVNQISWNESSYPSPAGPTAGADSWGWFHNKTDKWLWELSNTTNDDLDGCNNNEGTGLKIQPTQGLASLVGATAATYSNNNSEWSVWNISSGPLQHYCIAVHKDCKRLMIYKFDLNSSLPSPCTNKVYIIPGSFAPNAEKLFWVKPHISYGVPAGAAMNSTVTVTAS